MTESSGSRPNLPLAGIKVIDFGQIYQGPYATLLMAKAGADVVKVEPIGGEPMRMRANASKGAGIPLAMHYVISPVAAVTGVLPIPMGPFELVLEFLYQQTHPHLPGKLFIPTGQGLVVALGYRLICVLIAMVGVCYYLSSRREVAEMMHEAEVSQDFA